jgi:hypothetical protein
MNTFGPEFTQSMLPQLVRLLPAKDKRECLLKKGGFLQPPAAAPQSLFADAPAAPAAPPAAPPASQSLFATTNDPFAAPTNAFSFSDGEKQVVMMGLIHKKQKWRGQWVERFFQVEDTQLSYKYPMNKVRAVRARQATHMIMVICKGFQQ